MNDEQPRGRGTVEPQDNNPEWSEEDFARARPASQVLGKHAAAMLSRKRRRPQGLQNSAGSS
jgi:hypothetical protein